MKQAVKNKSLRSLLVLALILGSATYVMASLGYWQLDRACQKQALAHHYEQGLALPPLDLNLITPAQPEPWQSVQVAGHWLPNVSLLLDNRALNGQPGYWVVGMLKLSHAPAHVVVVRGWVARRFDGLPSWTTSVEQVQLEGRVLSHIPKLYALGEDPVLDFSPSSGTHVVQNLEIQQLAQATGLNVLPFVVQQTSATEDGLLRGWEPPLFDANKHRAYALQWFVFAGFALFVLGVSVVRYIRSNRSDQR